MQVQFSFADASGSLGSEQDVRAASDLLGRIQTRAPRRIANLQVGPRSARALLAKRFPEAEIVSLHASRQELAQGNEFDLIFLNGDLELLPSLRELLPVLVRRLSFGGSLAVQIPDNLYEPNRALLRMVAADGPWATKLLPVAKTRPFNEMMEGLYALLCPICASVEIWETTYLYALGGRSDHRSHEGHQPRAVFASTRRTFAQKVSRSLCDRTGDGVSGAAGWHGPSAVPEDFCIGAALTLRAPLRRFRFGASKPQKHDLERTSFPQWQCQHRLSAQPTLCRIRTCAPPVPCRI